LWYNCGMDNCLDNLISNGHRELDRKLVDAIKIDCETIMAAGNMTLDQFNERFHVEIHDEPAVLDRESSAVTFKAKYRIMPTAKHYLSIPPPS
jgi:hypothetical protein